MDRDPEGICRQPLQFPASAARNRHQRLALQRPGDPGFPAGRQIVELETDMNKLSNLIGRRRVLRGMLAGGAVSVGLPILGCMLDPNGEAFAATGAPIPLRFSTWFWGLGFGEGAWVPKTS